MLSKRIDAAELEDLAACGEHLRLPLAVGKLARVAALVAQDAGGAGDPLKAEVTFGTGADGFPRLRLELTGCIPLQCQRCLQPMTWPLRLTTELAVLGKDKEAEQLADPFDSIVVDAGGLVLETVIEDEILAALPMAPVHEPADCAAPGAATTGLESGAGQTHRPFAALATLVGARERSEE